jgi:hypothetical protein
MKCASVIFFSFYEYTERGGLRVGRRPKDNDDFIK